jgi:hypothetical protein
LLFSLSNYPENIFIPSRSIITGKHITADHFLSPAGCKQQLPRKWHYIRHLYTLQTPFKSCHSDEKFSGENFITESRIAKSQ